MRGFVIICAVWLALIRAGFAEKLPPKPTAYFNDYAHVVPASTASALDEKLRQFERDTSNQIVVAVFPKMESASSVSDFAYRTFESWGVGQKDRRNGAVLFVFVADHQMFIEVGYGLEGVLPDVICKQIVSDEIAPAFKAGHYDVGLTAGVDSMIKATRGEYVGNGKTAGDRAKGPGMSFWLWVGFFVLLFVLQVWSNSRGNVVYGSSRGSFARGLLWGILSNLGNSGGGGSYRGGGGGCGGGFIGGGGSSGGGGAGGSW